MAHLVLWSSLFNISSVLREESQMSAEIEIIDCDDQFQDTYDFKGTFFKFIQGRVVKINS